ncbi:MAG: 4Fe-4S binding protein [Planctomycetales bacterium]|nr:4Fe-4S binding protein [Planctomycetales bacterium]
MPAKVDSATCSGCGACVDTCPSEAIEMQNGKAVVSADKCVDCGVCVDECPVEAIRME